MAVVRRVLKASFSSTVISIVTFGRSAMYASAMACQFACSLSAVLMCHHVMVTFSGAASVGVASSVGAASVCVSSVGSGVAAGVGGAQDTSTAPRIKTASTARVFKLFMCLALLS